MQGAGCHMIRSIFCVFRQTLNKSCVFYYNNSFIICVYSLLATSLTVVVKIKIKTFLVYQDVIEDFQYTLPFIYVW